MKRLAPILLLLTFFAFLTGLSYADPRVTTGAVSAANSVIGQYDNEHIGSAGVYELPSGNLVIVSPDWGDETGAVTCLTPAEYQAGNTLIEGDNSLRGSSESDFVGSGGIAILSNGNYVVRSPMWGAGIGALTLVNGTTCIPIGESSWGAQVSASNSLITQATEDDDGFFVTALTNGNYVVYYNGVTISGVVNAGVAMWCSGTAGCVGSTIDATNALVGTTTGDKVSQNGVIALPSGDYVVLSRYWDNGAAIDAGAVTFGDGGAGTVGIVSIANSLVGTASGHEVGDYAVVLNDGDYVVGSPYWDDGATLNVGAVIRCDGAAGCAGVISTSNSLVGDTAGDRLGYNGITILSNGNYVVASQYWNDAIPNVGAVTLCDAVTGCPNLVTAANSLIGDSDGDLVGNYSVTALLDGDYVVGSPTWDDGATTNAGAATWCDGDTGCGGMMVSAANSLIGSNGFDLVGSNILALTNGNYVVGSASWDSPTASNAGAVVWADGDGGTVGTISAANALIGTATEDGISSGAIYALSNGNYVVPSILWDDGAQVDAGAVTWGNGEGGTVGEVSAANSLIGIGTPARISFLTTGHYIIAAPAWDNGATLNVGAVIWGNGTGGTVGTVSAANALIGTTAEDSIGSVGVYVLPDNDYVVASSLWDNDATADVGAVTLGSGLGGTVGAVSAANSLIGEITSDKIGSGGVVALANAAYVVVSPYWNSPTIVDAGAVTYSGDAPAPLNLLTNGGFETAGATTKKAANWTVANPKTTDKRLCTATSTEGVCVFQFNTGVTPPLARSLKQTLTTGDLGGAGETLTLSAMVEGNKFKTGAKIVVTVTYTDSTTAKKNIIIPNGTYAFTEISGSLNLTKTVQKIVVNVTVAKVTGRVRLDELWLTLSDTARLAFPVIGARDGADSDTPAAPDGFRH